MHKFLSLLAGLWLGFATLSQGAVCHSNGSDASVQACHDAGATGDTITIPAGSFTWSTGVVISKGIILKGMNSTNTIINRGTGFTGALVTLAGFTSDVPVRVYNLRFNSPVGQFGDLYSVAVTGPWDGTWAMTQVRIDHCYFYGGQRTLFYKWRVNGVVDHNTFQDCAIIFLYNGDDDPAWTRAGTPAFGTSDAVFFEDNTILMDNTISYVDTLSDINTGGRCVWRKNTFNLTAFTGTFGSLIESHGNQDYWHGSDTDWLRAGVMNEVYNNTFSWSSAFRIFWFRGGRALVANNKMTGSFGGLVVAFDEEEGVGGIITPTRTGPWPAEDQINNTFIFGNKLNGVALSGSLVGNWQTGSNPYVQVSRDFWLQAPSMATQTVYPQPGTPSLPNYPLPYNPSVTSWTPYTYPHPLVTP